MVSYMRNKFKNYSDRLIRQISMNQDKYEILKYGLHQCFMITLNFVSVLISGIFWNKVLFSILLFICMYLFRPYVGGYHADTEIGCYIVSVGIMNMAMAGSKWIHLSIQWMCLLYLGAVFIIGINAPVQNPINPLEDEETIKYSRHTKKIMIIYSLVGGIGIVSRVNLIYDTIFYGMLIACCSVVGGKYKYKV